MAINNITQIKGSDTVETTINNINSNFQQLASLNGGPQGPAGVQGVPGLPGLQGLQGIQGERGIDGDTIEYVEKGAFPSPEDMKEHVSYIGQDTKNNVIMRKLNIDNPEGYDEVILVANEAIDLSGFMTVGESSSTNAAGAYLNPRGESSESRLAISYVTDNGDWGIGFGLESQKIGDSTTASSDTDKVLIATTNNFDVKYYLRGEEKQLKTTNFISFVKPRENKTTLRSFLCLADNTEDTENSIIMSFLGGNNAHTSFYAYNLYAQKDILTKPGGFIGCVDNGDNTVLNVGIKKSDNEGYNEYLSFYRSGDYSGNYCAKLCANGVNINSKDGELLLKSANTSMTFDTTTVVLYSGYSFKMNSCGPITIGEEFKENGPTPDKSPVTIGGEEWPCPINIGYGKGEVTIGAYTNSSDTNDGSVGRVTIGASGSNFDNIDDDSTCDINIGYGRGVVTIGGYQKPILKDSATASDRGSVVIGIKNFERSIIIGAKGSRGPIYIADGLNEVHIGNIDLSHVTDMINGYMGTGLRNSTIEIGTAKYTKTSVMGDFIAKNGNDGKYMSTAWFKLETLSGNKNLIEIVGNVHTEEPPQYITYNEKSDKDAFHASSIIIDKSDIHFICASSIGDWSETWQDNSCMSIQTISNYITVTYVIKKHTTNGGDVVLKDIDTKYKYMHSLKKYIEIIGVYYSSGWHIRKSDDDDAIRFEFLPAAEDIIMITIPYMHK